MSKSKIIIFAALAAVVVLSLATGPASARTKVEVSTTALLATGRLTFNNGLADVICDVTLHATLLRLIEKIDLAHAGDITAILTANARSNIGAAAECSGLAPMRLGYESIRGTLPSGISGGTLWVDAGFLMRVAGTGCLYREVIRSIATENPVRRVTIETEPNQRLFRILEEEFFRRCPREGTLLGELRFTPEVTIRLLER